MTVLLSDVAKQETEPLKKGVIQSLLRYSNVLGVVPFENVDALNSIAVRWKTLPSVGTRKINEGYSESSGTTEQAQESVTALGGDVDIDKVFDKVSNYIQDPKVTQTKMKTKAIAYKFNDLFINGDPLSNEEEFPGLKYRVGQLPSRQTIGAGGTSGSDTAFDVTSSSGNIQDFLDSFHKLNALVDGADAYFCNFDVRLGIQSALRRSGLLATNKDQFERTVYSFDGAPIIDVGLKSDQSTEIITNTETAYDGGSDATSVYAVKFGTDEGLTGIQLEPMAPYWVGGEGNELESKPVRRLRIDWWVGLAGFGKYYIARMDNLLDPASWT